MMIPADLRAPMAHVTLHTPVAAIHSYCRHSPLPTALIPAPPRLRPPVDPRRRGEMRLPTSYRSLIHPGIALHPHM